MRGKGRYGKGARSGPSRNDSRGSMRTSPSFTGMIAELPTLLPQNSREFNVMTNGVQHFKERLTLYLVTKYGSRGNFLVNGAYEEPDIPEEPDVQYDENNRLSVVLWRTYEAGMAEAMKDARKARTERSAWFTTILGQLSQASRDLVETQDDWEAARDTQDPLQLWTIIEATHLAPQSGSRDLDQFAAMETFNQTVQGHSEPVSNYRRRLERAVEALVALEHPTVPNEAAQVIKFIKGLNSRHGEWARYIHNQMIGGGEAPPTIEAAARAAAQYIPAGHSTERVMREGTSTAFLTQEEVKAVKTEIATRQDHKSSDSGTNQAMVAQKSFKSKKEKASTSAKPRHIEEKDEDPPEVKPAKGACNICGKPGHYAQNCRYRDKVQKLIAEGKIVAVTTGTAFLDESGEPLLGPTDILLDNEANCSLFHNMELLDNIRDGPRFEVMGVGPNAVVSTKVGDFGPFGEVHYSPDARANVLCFDDVADKYTILWNQADRKFSVPTPNGVYVFCRKGKLYVCDAIVPRWTTHEALVSTVSDNESNFSRREVTMARNARELLRRLAFIPSDELRRMLNQGAVVNCPITSRDVTTADEIYGPDVPSLKGRTVRRSPTDSRTLEPSTPVAKPVLVMHSDVIFVNNNAFLLSVFSPINLTCVTDIRGTRAQPMIRSGLDEQLNIVENAGYTVNALFCDGEFADDQIRVPMANRGIALDICGPEQHVSVVERKARVVKERVRAQLHALPYRLPAKLLTYLVMFVVYCLNCVPVKSGGDFISPRERIVGRKLNFNRDLRFEFGSYVQAKTPNIVSNSMSARTEGDLTLLSTGNVEGTVLCYNIATGRVVPRDRWTVLPIPDIVIQHLNALADADKLDRRVTRDPIFRLGGIELGDGDMEPTDMVDAPDGKEGKDTQLGGESDVGAANAERLSLRIPADEWKAGRERKLRLVLEEDTVRDSDGDVVMDLSDSVDYDGGAAYAAFGLVPSEAVRVPNWIFRMTVERARRVHGEDKTMAVLRTEIELLLKKDVLMGVHWQYLTEEERSAIIRCSIFVKEKFTPDGAFDRLRARLVAGGHLQDRSIYSEDETSSPTATTSAVFMVAAIAAKEKRHVVTMDFAGAYLNAAMKKKVLMRLDPTLSKLLVECDADFSRFVGPKGNVTVQLKKALYGCVESAKLWYDLLSNKMKGLGYVSNEYEPCVFNKDLNGNQVTVVVYVDDLMITCVDSETLDDAILEVDGLFEGTTLHRGSTHSYIGMIFDFDSDSSVAVKMDGYLDDIIVDYEVSGVASSPASAELFDIDSDSTSLGSDESQVFHSRVAKLLYMAKRARPDILTAVSFLCTRVQAPTQQDMFKLERVLRYLNGSRDIWLVLSVSDDYGVEAYIDAAFGVHGDGKGHTGCCITLGSGFFYVQSAKQRLVSKSSTEAELIGISDALSMVLWVRNFLRAQGLLIGPAVVFQDNKSTVAMAEKGRSTSSRTRHINIRYFFVKDRIESGEVVLEYKPTGEMVADLLTKPLQGQLFRYLRSKILNVLDGHAEREERRVPTQEGGVLEY